MIKYLEVSGKEILETPTLKEPRLLPSLSRYLGLAKPSSVIKLFEEKTFADVKATILMLNNIPVAFMKPRVKEEHLDNVVNELLDDGFELHETYLRKSIESSQKEIALFPEDPYKSVTEVVVDLEILKVTSMSFLYRVTNKSLCYIPEKSKSKSFPITNSTSASHIIERANVGDLIVMYLKETLAKLKRTKVNANQILLLKTIATKLGKLDLMGVAIKEARTILDSYEVSNVPTVFSSIVKDGEVPDDYTLLLIQVQPTNWRKTAFGNAKEWEIWNYLTEAITHAEFHPRDEFSFHVRVGKEFFTTNDIIIAKPKIKQNANQ